MSRHHTGEESARPRRGRTGPTGMLELEVGPVAHGGHCVARHEGRVVFVRHALPGERVRAVVDEDGGGSFCRADAVAVLAPRRTGSTPPCSWARAGGCGGCDLQHADPRRAAAAQGRRCWPSSCPGWPASTRRGRVVEELPGGRAGLAHRVRLAVDETGAAGLRAHRSHDVLPDRGLPAGPAGHAAAGAGRDVRPRLARSRSRRTRTVPSTWRRARSCSARPGASGR